MQTRLNHVRGDNVVHGTLHVRWKRKILHFLIIYEPYACTRVMKPRIPLSLPHLKTEACSLEICVGQRVVVRAHLLHIHHNVRVQPGATLCLLHEATPLRILPSVEHKHMFAFALAFLLVATATIQPLSRVLLQLCVFTHMYPQKNTHIEQLVCTNVTFGLQFASPFAKGKRPASATSLCSLYERRLPTLRSLAVRCRISVSSLSTKTL